MTQRSPAPGRWSAGGWRRQAVAPAGSEPAMSEATYVADLIDQDDDFDRWYGEVIQKAELADHAPVRGCKVIRPYGFSLWEQMVARLDARIKATGVANAYFPMFIPKSLLDREAAHV